MNTSVKQSPELLRAIFLIRKAHDLISTNDPRQSLIGQLDGFLKDMGVTTIDEDEDRSASRKAAHEELADEEVTLGLPPTRWDLAS
jgi:hypothetical protein